MKTGELLSKLEGLRRQADFAENRIERVLAENAELQSKNKRLENSLRTQKSSLKHSRRNSEPCSCNEP